MQRVSLAGLLDETVAIIPGFDAEIPAAVVYTNAAELGMRRFLEVMLQGRYRAFHGGFEPVMIGRLPDDALLLGGDSYWLAAGGGLAIDQINPLTPDVDAQYQALRDLPFAEERVDAPCLLLSRYGDVTWGHWLAEILPRAIMAERAYPKRFQYVIGGRILAPEAGAYGERVLESLAAYGIAADRLFRLRLDRHYRFSDLHAVTGIWSAPGMNTEVMRLMREQVATPGGQSPRRLAVLRRDAATRRVANHDEVARGLSARDFTIANPGRQTFLEQIALFREAETVFGVLGSGLAGLIYAPEGVRLASLAPGAWADTYFHGLMQLRRGWHADIRCPVLWTGEGLERDAPVLAPVRRIETGLEALAAAPRASMEIGGTRLRRDVGETLISVDFGADGLAEAGVDKAVLGEGWSFSEPRHTWSVGTRSTMRVRRPAVIDRIDLELDVVALTNAESLPTRKLDVMCAGMRIGSFCVAEFATLSCPVPPGLFGAEAFFELAFETPFCVPARATGHGPDDRPIGIGFLRLRLVRHAG